MITAQDGNSRMRRPAADFGDGLITSPRRAAQDGPPYLYRALIQADVGPLNRERFADPQSGGDQEEYEVGKITRSIARRN
jgi:hypothetical protein